MTLYDTKTLLQGPSGAVLDDRSASLPASACGPAAGVSSSDPLLNYVEEPLTTHPKIRW